jgi:hypothetical protein
MKYLITESKLENTITNYLNELFDIDNINMTHPIEDNEVTDDWSEDENRVLFYIGDYDNDDDKTCFRWYGKMYFDNLFLRERAPLVYIEHGYAQKLNGYFGDLWHEPFKKWFRYHFEYPIKTVE